MRRIHFTAESLASTRFLIDIEQIRETLLALDVLSTGVGGEAFRAWRKRTAGRSDIRRMISLAQALRPLPDLDHVVQTLLQGDPDAPEVATQSRLSADLESFRQIAIAPYWASIERRLAADRAARSEIVLSGGWDQMFTSLHRAIRWDPPVLEVPGEGEDVKLGSEGLWLAPSLFLAARPPILFDRYLGQDRPTLLYPIPIDWGRSSSIWDAVEEGNGALHALMGRTRAAVLVALSSSATTTEVGERVGISSAAASQHTAVLRAAGLITTLRSLNRVQHTLTPLGAALITRLH
ncbi:MULTISPECIES: winged helix-turn-helix domain-containing protein [unclassified Kitasatospora]|uniref:ArsR/SmtB family transcription factor n=1 Tax=unclassified Kitasatospora TaxID=2633591 RepID=UPI0033C4B2B0